MDYRRFENRIVMRVDRGEEVVSNITEVCKKENVKLASVSGIGAADRVKMGLYNVEEQKYKTIELNQPLEITSLLGNVTTKDGELYLHLHINLGDEEGRTWGGHLNEVVIGGTCEIFIDVIDGRVERMKDEIKGTGLNIFKF